MTPNAALRVRTLGVVFGVSAVLAFLVVRLLTGQFGRLTVPSWPGLALLSAVVGGLLVAGMPIRRWRAGRLKRRLDPIAAFRTLILARAAALAGAVAAGAYGALGVVFFLERGPDGISDGVAWCAAYVGAGIVLMIVGLLIQSWCRIDPPDESPGGDVGQSRPDQSGNSEGSHRRTMGADLSVSAAPGERMIVETRVDADRRTTEESWTR